MRIIDELRESQGPARALAQFALSGLIAVALLGIVAVEVMRRQGTDEAIRDAKQVTKLAGDGIVAPNVTKGLLRGDAREIRRMDRMVRNSIINDSVVRVKLWSTRGEVIYSDEH